MILVGSINLSNNIRDLEGDKKGGRKTLAVLFGKKNASSFWLPCLLFHIFGSLL